MLFPLFISFTSLFAVSVRTTSRAALSVLSSGEVSLWLEPAFPCEEEPNQHELVLMDLFIPLPLSPVFQWDSTQPTQVTQWNQIPIECTDPASPLSECSEQLDTKNATSFTTWLEPKEADSNVNCRDLHQPTALRALFANHSRQQASILDVCIATNEEMDEPTLMLTALIPTSHVIRLTFHLVHPTRSIITAAKRTLYASLGALANPFSIVFGQIHIALVHLAYHLWSSDGNRSLMDTLFKADVSRFCPKGTQLVILADTCELQKLPQIECMEENEARMRWNWYYLPIVLHWFGMIIIGFILVFQLWRQSIRVRQRLFALDEV